MGPALLSREQNINKALVTLNASFFFATSKLNNQVMDALKFIYSEFRETLCSHETYGAVVSPYKYAYHLEIYASLCSKKRTRPQIVCTGPLR
jgi:hypothetical protein